MGMYIRQDDNRSKLQEKIAADLADKARQKALADKERPDGVEDSAFLEHSKSTTSLALVWIILMTVGIGVMIWLVVASS